MSLIRHVNYITKETTRKIRVEGCRINQRSSDRGTMITSCWFCAVLAAAQCAASPKRALSLSHCLLKATNVACNINGLATIVYGICPAGCPDRTLSVKDEVHYYRWLCYEVLVLVPRLRHAGKCRPPTGSLSLFSRLRTFMSKPGMRTTVSVNQSVCSMGTSCSSMLWAPLFVPW